MTKMIRVQVECIHPDSENIPEDLRDTIDNKSEFRPGYIFINHIVGIYPHNKSGTLIEMSNAITWTVKESFEEIENKINYACKEVQ